MDENAATGTIFNIQKFSLNDGPGIRTVVFFKGCPLRCAWCANPESQSPRPQLLWDGRSCRHCGGCIRNCPAHIIKDRNGQICIDHRRCLCTGSRPPCAGYCPGHALTLKGKLMRVKEVVQAALQDEPFYEESGGGVTLSGGEPLLQPKFALALLKTLKGHGIHTAIETTGFAAPEVLQDVLPYLDLLLFDIKHWDETKHMEGTGVSNQPILRNMQYAIGAGKEVLPRLPVIPGYNDSPADARGFARRLQETGARCVQLLPFHQLGENKYRMLGRNYSLADKKALHPEELEDFRQVFLKEGIAAFF